MDPPGGALRCRALDLDRLSIYIDSYASNNAVSIWVACVVQMPTTVGRRNVGMVKRILIVVDPSPAAQSAIDEGVGLAAVHDAEVVFFHMLPQYPIPMVEELIWTIQAEDAFDRAARAEGQRLLAAAAAVAERAGVMHRSVVRQGQDTVTGIVDAARRRRCDLVVVASEGSNAVMRLMNGSVIPGLISAAPMPVMVCKGHEDSSGGRMLSVVSQRPAQLPKMMRVAL